MKWASQRVGMTTTHTYADFIGSGNHRIVKVDIAASFLGFFLQTALLDVALDSSISPTPLVLDPPSRDSFQGTLSRASPETPHSILVT